jgi:hypothetical protein
MILTALVLGAIFGGAVLVFWKEIGAWLKRVVSKVQEMINMAVVGVKTFAQRIGNRLKEIAKNYSRKEDGKWQETIVTKEVEMNDVPADILAKVNKSTDAVDISQELELELGK